jgi:cytochrome P450
MPTSGIARATGERSLLYANGSVWREQKQLVAPPFARSTLFQPEVFSEFESTFRRIAADRLEALRRRVAQSASQTLRVKLEPEIKTAMLEMLVNCFFGASVPTEELRSRDVPAMDLVIDNIVKDTIMAKVGCPMHRLPGFFPGMRRARAASSAFEELVTRVIEQRARGEGAWKQFECDASDEALRPNIRVFLAGALEATTNAKDRPAPPDPQASPSAVKHAFAFRVRSLRSTSTRCGACCGAYCTRLRVFLVDMQRIPTTPRGMNT